MKKSQYYSNLAAAALLFLGGCSYSLNNWEYRKAENASEKSDYKKALEHYSKVIIRNPESNLALISSRKASRLALFQVKSFDEAIRYFRHIVQFSKDVTERKSAQREIADIYYNKKVDYKAAIEEYNSLLALKLPNEDFLDIKLRIARAHYYLSEFFQAESEVQNALLKANKGQQKFQLELFLANIYFNTKRLDKAVEAYKKLDDEYPKLAIEEKIKMSLVVCYEETEKFDEAIQLLKNMKSDKLEDPSFIDLKIARLQERKRNLPGSRGLRK